jgi:hypothetical protein
VAEQVYGFGAEDVRRLRKMLAFYESFMRKPDMRRPQMPATVHGLDYVYGTLTSDLAIDGTGTMDPDMPVDAGESGSMEVYGRWFSASTGDIVGATFNPYTDQWDVDRKRCEFDETDGGSDDIDGGSAGDGGDTEDGGDPDTGGGDLDGGTP